MKAIHKCVFRRHATSKRSSAPRGQVILESLSKRLESPRRGSRGLIYDLPATARPARIQGVAGFGGRSGANVISIAAESMPWWAIPCETLQFPARLNKFPVRRELIPCSDF